MTEELVVEVGSVRLAGSLWLPDTAPVGIVLMHPGSGPSDRHNDTFFPPIRAALLEAGLAVASFDKRGVGGSGGSWITSTIEEQAGDLRAADAALRDRLPGLPVVWFGHSQGGWVVVEAASLSASTAPVGVVVSSGPGVGPAAQERHALAVASEGDAEAALTHYDRLVDLVISGASYEDAVAVVDELRPVDRLAEWVEREEVWTYLRSVTGYDPTAAQRRLVIPTLVLLGELDPIVPVEASIEAYRRNVRAGVVTVEVVPGGDHRMRSGAAGELIGSYLDTVVAFAVARVTRETPS